MIGGRDRAQFRDTGASGRKPVASGSEKQHVHRYFDRNSCFGQYVHCGRAIESVGRGRGPSEYARVIRTVCREAACAVVNPSSDP